MDMMMFIDPPTVRASTLFSNYITDLCAEWKK